MLCLLNLSNELGKSDIMRGWPSIVSLFRNSFDKFNNTGARMLDLTYHVTLNLFCNHIILALSNLLCKVILNVIMCYVTKLVKH